MSNFFVRELELEDTTLEIYQNLEGDVGCVIWDAAICLAKYIDGHNFKKKNSLFGRHVIELGAGTGIVGLVAATQGAHVTITDLEDFVPLMQKNIEHNKNRLRSCNVNAKTLKWGTDFKITDKYDFILMADLIYYDESLAPLVQTMDTLCSNETIILMSYEERTTGNKPELERKFFKLAEQHFKMRKIPREEQDSVYSSDDIHIIEMRRK
eukprot:gene12015-13255_t